MGKRGSLEHRLNKATSKLRAYSDRVITRGEPMRLMQDMKFDLLTLRAEAMAFRDEIKENSFNVTRFQRRFLEHVETFSEIMSQALGIAITDDGQIIEGAKSSAQFEKANKWNN